MAAPKEKSVRSVIKSYFWEMKFKLKRISYSYWILYLNIFIVFIVLISPFLLRLTLVRKFVSFYLDSFPNTEYKTSFIALLGGLLGTVVSITGALAIQDIFSKKERVKEKIDKEEQGVILFHKFVSTEFFTNFNLMYEKIEGDEEMVILSVEEVIELQGKLRTDKFNRFYEKLLDFNPELTSTIAKVYELFEKVCFSQGELQISKKEFDDFIYFFD